MFECKTCGRKFKTMQELGGHVSGAHPKPGEPSGPVGEGESSPAVVATESAEKPPADSPPAVGQPDAQANGVKQAAASAPGEKPPDARGPNEKPPPAPAAGGNADVAGQPAAAKTPAPEPGQESSSDEEAGVAEQIRQYREEGMTFKQLVNDLGFKASTVRDVISKEVIAQNKAEAEKASLLPLVIKNGKGEMIAPEAVIWQMAVEEGVNGERDFKALMKWAAAIEMVHRMTEIRKTEAEALAATARPVLEMMEKSREELDAAVARAKESSMAIAEAAAAGAAARATMHIDERINELKEVRKEKVDIATVQDPVSGLIARTMEMMMNQFSGMLFGGGSAGGIAGSSPGLVDRRMQQGG